jgi:putative protease
MPIKKKKAKKKAVKKRIVKRNPAKKKIVKKKPTAKKKVAAVTARAKGLGKQKIIGKVTHYFPHVRAAVIKLKVPLSVGDSIRIKGHTTDFTQKITSMQIDRVPISSGKKGDEIGLLVDSRVRQHDVVYKA